MSLTTPDPHANKASWLLRAAHEAAAAQDHPPGALYVVATPIGNLADLTLRGIHLLAQADCVACEDTRHSARLLHLLGLSKPLLACHEHNEAQAAERVIGALRQSQRVVFVSDAGTPAVSDPGAALVAAVRSAGLRVVPVPGPSAVAAALSVAGDANGSGFVFRGFLPARGAQRQAAVAQLAQEPMTQVLFEAPHRMEALRRELAEQLPDRTVTVCKELTKQFESIHTLSAATLIDQLSTEDAHPDREAQPAHERGEFVLVVHAATPRGALDSAAGELDASTQRTLSVLLQELPVKQAVALTAQLTGASRNTLYEAALRLRNAT